MAAKETGQLDVFVVDGKLRDVEKWLGEQSPYCVLECGGHKFKTRVCPQGGEEPIWNERLLFLNVGPTTAPDLVIRVWNKCTFNDKEIGASCINLKRIYAAGLGCEELQVPLQTHKGKSGGELRVMLIYNPGPGGAATAQPQLAAQAAEQQQPAQPASPLAAQQQLPQPASPPAAQQPLARSSAQQPTFAYSASFPPPQPGPASSFQQPRPQQQPQLAFAASGYTAPVPTPVPAPIAYPPTGARSTPQPQPQPLQPRPLASATFPGPGTRALPAQPLQPVPAGAYGAHVGAVSPPVSPLAYAPQQLQPGAGAYGGQAGSAYLQQQQPAAAPYAAPAGAYAQPQQQAAPAAGFFGQAIFGVPVAQQDDMGPPPAC